MSKTAVASGLSILTTNSNQRIYQTSADYHHLRLTKWVSTSSVACWTYI